MSRHSERSRTPLSAVTEFLSVEAISGCVLVLATIAALAWANVSFASYEELWSTHLTLGVGSLAIDESLQHWINDGLMAVFFFVVGLEVKREIVRGELRDPRTAALPVLGAVGGMAVPAVVFLAWNLGDPASEGWAVPTATDIAFAVAILAILGTRVPSGAKVFLLTLAIADDIGAIVIIAIFYSDHVSFAWLFAALCVVIGIVGMQKARVGSPFAYILPAFLLWLFVFEAGVHATIAGVVLGLLTPARPFGGRQVIESLEHRLHGWSSFLIVPLFAIANTGIQLGVMTLERAAGSPITWGIVLGLVVGKPLGIVIATSLGARSGIGRLPDGMTFRHVLGVGQLAGIGFTVALFVASLTYTRSALATAKIGILTASVLSAAFGVTVLVTRRQVRSAGEPPRRH